MGYRQFCNGWTCLPTRTTTVTPPTMALLAALEAREMEKEPPPSIARIVLSSIPWVSSGDVRACVSLKVQAWSLPLTRSL